MPTLFIALPLQAMFCHALATVQQGVGGARWQDDALLHLTLRYIGAVEDRAVEDIADTLSGLYVARVTVAAAGVGVFETRGRAHSLWAGVTPEAPLADLHRKLDRALVASGLPPERRAYRPHITVARIARSRAEPGAVATWLATHGRFATEPFAIDRLILFETIPSAQGSIYHPVLELPLQR